MQGLDDQCSCNVVKCNILTNATSASNGFQGFYAQFIAYFRRRLAETYVDYSCRDSFLHRLLAASGN